MVEKLKDRPFELLGVNCESEKVLTQLVSDAAVTWRSWADGQNGPIATSWQISGYPRLFLIDHRGIIRWRSSGVPDPTDLDKRIEQLIAEVD